MAKIHLTDLAVERINRPKTGRKEISDSEPGLFLLVTTTGLKTWMVIYRLPGADGDKRTTRRKAMIGRHPDLGVTAAREKARELMALAAQGIDPEAHAAEQEAAAEKEAEEREADSFRSVSAQWVSAMRARKRIGGKERAVTAETARARESHLNRLVIPDLGDYPLAEITPKMIARVLGKIEKADGPVDTTLAIIRGVYKFAGSRGLYSGLAPTHGMMNRQARMKEKRALTDPELRAIWMGAREMGGFYGLAVRLMMLTGQRRQEIGGLMWSEVHRDRRMLIIPPDRAKNRKGSHEVMLSDAAMAILDEAEKLAKEMDKKSLYVFPSASTENDTPLSGWNKLKDALDRTIRASAIGLTDAERRALRAPGALRPETRKAKADALAKLAEVQTADWGPHAFRHTVFTRARQGEQNPDGEVTWRAPLDVVQAVVNHRVVTGLAGVYDHGDIQLRYRLEKRQLLEWWSRKLLHIVGEGPADDNVVTLPMGGRQ